MSQLALEHDAPFGARTTLRVGGRAATFLEASSVKELVALARTRSTAVPIYVLGRGSNTLVADEGFEGIVVHLSDAFATIEIEERTEHGALVVAGGATDLPVLARRSVEAGLTGLEWAVGVPGSVGGGVRMNAGGHGSDIAASLRSARVVDLATGEIETLDPPALAFSYRHSSIRPEQVVIDATFELSEGDPEEGRALLRDIVRWRRAHQPGGANCGSVFTNPDGDSAGRLIEAAGLRGVRLGTAQVSDKHANFIQADPHGSGNDVAALIEKVVAEVASSQGVTLATEVRTVGFSGGAS